MTASVADSMRQRFQDLLERHGVQTRPRDRYRTSHTALQDAPTSTAPAKQLTTAAPVALAVIEFLGPSIDARKLGATNRAWSFYVRHAEGWGEVLRRRAPQLYHSLIDGYCNNLNAGGGGGSGTNASGGGGVLSSSSKTHNAMSTSAEATNPNHKQRSSTQAVGLISIAWLDELDSLQRRLAPVGSDVTRRHPPPRKPLLARLKSVALRLPVSPHIVVLGIPQSGQTTLMSSLLRAGEIGDELAGAEDEGGIYSNNLSVATNAPPAAAPPVGGRSGSPVLFGAPPSANSQGLNNNGGGGSPTAGIGMHVDMQKISAPPDGRWGFFVVGVQGEELSSAPSYAPVKMTYHGSVVTPAVTHDHDSLNNTLATTSSSSRQFPSPTVPQTRRNVAPPATPSNRPSREGVLRKTNDNGEGKDTQQGGDDKDGDEHTTPSTAVFDENGDDVKHPSTLKHRSSGGVGRHDDDIESDDTSDDDDNNAAMIQGLDDDAARAAAKDRTRTHRRRRSGHDDDDTMVSVQSDCSGCSGCSGCAEVGESTYMNSLRDDASSMAWLGSPATKRLSSHSFRGYTDRHHKHRNQSRSRSRGRAHRHSSKKEKGPIDKSENAGHQDDGEAVGKRQQHAHHHHGRECACHRCAHDRDGRTYDDDDADLDDELESGRLFFTASENSASFDDDDDNSFMDSSSFSDGASRRTHDFLDAHSSDGDGTSISDDTSMTDGSSSSVLSIGTAPVSFGFNEDDDDADLLSEMMRRSSSLRLGYDSRRESRLGDSRHSRNTSDAFFSRGRGRRMQLSAHSTPHHAHSHPPQRDVSCLDQDRRRPPHRTPHTSTHSRHHRDNTQRHGVDRDHDLDDRSEKQQDDRRGHHHGRGSGHHRRGHSHGRPRYQKKASSLSALSGGAVVGTPCRASRSSTLLHGDHRGQEPASPLFPDPSDRRRSSSDKSTAALAVANNGSAENNNASTSANGTVPGVIVSGINRDAVAPKSALKRDDSAAKKKVADASEGAGAEGKTDAAVAPAIARKAPPPLAAPKSRPAVPSRRPDASPSAVSPSAPSSTQRPTVGVSKSGGPGKSAPLAPRATAPGVLHPPSSMPAGLHAPPSPSTLPRAKLSAPTPTAGGGLKGSASLSRSPPKVRSPGVAPTKPQQATTPVQLSQSLGSVGGSSPANNANNANKVNGNGRNVSPGGVSRTGAGAAPSAPEGTKTVTFGKTVSMVESEHSWWGGGDRNDDDPLYSDKLESGSGGGSLSKDVNDRIKALTESIRGLRDKGDEILRRREEKALEKRERRKAAAANKQAFGKLSALGMTTSSTSSVGGGNAAGGNGNGGPQRSSSTQQPQSASSLMNATAPAARVSSGGGGARGTNGDQGRWKVTGVSESNVSGGESDSDSDGEWRGADRDTGDGSPDGTSGKKKSLARQVVTRVKRAVENAELSLREALMAANFGESSDEESEDDDPAFTEATHSALPTSAPHWGSMLRHGPCHALVFVVDCRSVASAEASLAALKDKVLPYLAGGPAYPKLVQPASSILASHSHQHFRTVPPALGQGQIQGSAQGQNSSGRVAPQSPGRWQPGSGSAVGPTPKEKTISPMAVTPRAVITGPLSAATPRVGVAPTPRSNTVHPLTPNNTVNTPGGAGSRSVSRSASVPAGAPGPAPGQDADDNDGVAFGGPKALPPACRNLLVFANGQDVPHAVPPETVAVRVKTAVQWWGLDGTLQWRVIGSAAAAPRSGPALWDAMRWLK